VVLILVGLAVVMLANSMTKPLGRDEQMYCTGGALMAKGKMIYRDFSYAAQMPYHPLVYAALYRALNTTRYLLVGRIVSAICDVGVIVCIAGIYRRIFGGFRVAGALLGAAACVLYVFNPIVDYANGYAWNHDVVMFCVMLCLWLFVGMDFKGGCGYRRVAVIGAILTFATFMRITTVLAEILFFIVLLAHPVSSARERLKIAASFLVAVVLAASWPIWVIAHAPRAFFLNVVRIPALYGEWLHKIGMVHDKFKLTLSSLTAPGYLALIAAAIYFCVMLAYLRGRLKIVNRGGLLLAPLLAAAFFVIAYIPPTMWMQYLAMPVPFLAVGFAWPLLYLRELAGRDGQNKHFKIAATAVVVCAIVAAVSYPVAVLRTALLAAPESWTPIQLHRVSEDIVKSAKEPKLILTLGPLFALEGGGEIYTELSAGAVIYRVGDLLSADERAVTHTVGPKTLGELVEKSPPAAAIVGVEFEFLEEALLKSAVKTGWEKRVYEDGPTVYYGP